MHNTVPKMQAVQTCLLNSPANTNWRKVLACTVHMAHQVVEIMYRNICAEYELEVLQSKRKTLPRVVENDKVEIVRYC